MHISVNRYLKDKAMDHIDHALGRPVDPMGETYRNYFCTDIRNPEADRMAASPCWHMGRKLEGGMVYFHVTKHGRKALSDHLKSIGDKHRLFIVSYAGSDMPVAAESHGKARYKKWLDVSDASDISFKEFQVAARVRLAS